MASGHVIPRILVALAKCQNASGNLSPSGKNLALFEKPLPIVANLKMFRSSVRLLTYSVTISWQPSCTESSNGFTLFISVK